MDVGVKMLVGSSVAIVVDVAENISTVSSMDERNDMRSDSRDRELSELSVEKVDSTGVEVAVADMVDVIEGEYDVSCSLVELSLGEFVVEEGIGDRIVESLFVVVSPGAASLSCLSESLSLLKVLDTRWWRRVCP